MTTPRFPHVAPDMLSFDQRAAVEHVVASPRGATGGPFIPLLRSPELMTRLSDVGVYLRYLSDVPRSVFEMAVLLVARSYDQPFEWNHHAPLAIKAGLSRDTIAEIAVSRCPGALDGAHQAAYDVVNELLETRQLADSSFDRAISELGERGLVDLIGVVGYYAALAMVLNAARIDGPAPANDLPTIAIGWSPG